MMTEHCMMVVLSHVNKQSGFVVAGREVRWFFLSSLHQTIWCGGEYHQQVRTRKISTSRRVDPEERDYVHVRTIKTRFAGLKFKFENSKWGRNKNEKQNGWCFQFA